jgi:poly-gamma-glutamate synthesis protein (capsule biosynthesis protein)
VVHGHSPHVLRGIGVHRGRPILYSAGDLIDDYGARPIDRNEQSALFHVEFLGNVPRRVRATPTVVHDCSARRAPPDVAREIAARLVVLSGRLGTPATFDPTTGDVVVEL